MGEKRKNQKAKKKGQDVSRQDNRRGLKRTEKEERGERRERREITKRRGRREG